MEQRRTQQDAGLAASRVRPAELDDDALRRMLEGPFDEKLFEEESVRSEMMVRLFDFMLDSLKRTNMTAREAAEESKLFHRESERRSSELDASMRETRRLIEELIDG